MRAIPLRTPAEASPRSVSAPVTPELIPFSGKNHPLLVAILAIHKINFRAYSKQHNENNWTPEQQIQIAVFGVSSWVDLHDQAQETRRYCASDS